jgi:hypothetical protein
MGFNHLQQNFRQAFAEPLQAQQAQAAYVGPSGYIPYYARTVNIDPFYTADVIRILNMIDTLPVGNEVAIQIRGYRHGITRALTSNVYFTVTIYDVDGVVVATGSANSLGGSSSPEAGNYGGTISCAALVSGERYRMTIAGSGATLWTKWYYAQDRPTTW